MTKTLTPEEMELAKLIEMADETGAFSTGLASDPDTLIWHMDKEQLAKFAELIKANSIPDGYVLVPIEPTGEMIEIGGKSILYGANNRPEASWAEEAELAYKTMIAAKPN